MNTFYTIIDNTFHSPNSITTGNPYMFERFIYKRFETFDQAIEQLKMNIKQFGKNAAIEKFNKDHLHKKYSIVKLQKVDTNRTNIDAIFYEIIERIEDNEVIRDLIDKIGLLNDNG